MSACADATATRVDPASVPRLRELLPRVHTAFFSRFERPTEIQLQAVPSILAGEDVLLVAPTASGKSEAYAAPIAERLDRSARPGALIVSPTRALVNDLYRRLEAPFRNAGLSIGRRTAEHRDRVGGESPHVLILTPEALDSMLARRPETLRAVSMVALDEIHVLDGTPRGDQLRILLEPLERSTEQIPQRVAASATIDRPEELAARYLRAARVVSGGAPREIRKKCFHGGELADIARHVDALGRQGVQEDLGLRQLTKRGRAVGPRAPRAYAVWRRRQCAPWIALA